MTTRVITVQFPQTSAGACVGAVLADVDPETAGEQYECSVSQIETATQMETVLPACNNTTTPSSSTNKPCWAVIIDAAGCPSAGNLKLVVERAEQPAEGTVTAQCLAP